MMAINVRELSAHWMSDAVSAIEADPDLPVLQRIAGGDAAACSLLVDRHLQRLHALATRVLGSAADADEVCQDAFVRAWRQAPDWTPGAARFSSWLHQVVLNLCRDRLRSRRDLVPLEQLPEGAHEDTPEQVQGQADQSAMIRRALTQLPPRQREALLMCHFQGLTNIEAAAALALSVDALESLLARARRGLRGILQAPSAELSGVQQ
jgi:RNA polymerase sigma-70 factor, ECF subfamily